MLASPATLHREIAKCDVVCANCHRVRTLRSAPRQRREPGLARTRATERWHSRRQAQADVLVRLRARPCADCGRTFDPFVMEFDHRDAAMKTAAVSRMLGHAGLARILDEAVKCDIVCANCHRERTFRRRTVAAPGRE